MIARLHESIRTLPVRFPVAEQAGANLAAGLLGKRPLFVCVIASTDTALVPGISAAGASLELIPFTAAADAEMLAHGAARCIAGVPSNPLGPPGPSIITLAALRLAAIAHLIVDAGCRVRPDAPLFSLGGEPGGLISEGRAVPDARALFDRAFGLGIALGKEHEYLVLGESVPGGTTTALALLMALGFQAEGRVSSSLAGNAHQLKNRVARAALAHLTVDAGEDPLGAVTVLGDPMQPAVAGIAMGALSVRCPLLLAGGSQMMAVLALMRRLSDARGQAIDGSELGIATTRWVVDDPSADVSGLMREIGPHPLLATTLSFAHSRHAALRRYEDFLVKEGVGAGGAAVAAALTAAVSREALLEEIETIYDGLLARQRLEARAE
ncbi:MAG: TIGR00303 family protein [Chloroflexi bacterium]|nr:TIGR00303 family protein [Chloroflexota bacterium]